MTNVSVTETFDFIIFVLALSVKETINTKLLICMNMQGVRNVYVISQLMTNQNIDLFNSKKR